MKAEEGKMEVTAIYKKGGKEVDDDRSEHKLEVRKFPENARVAKVSLKFGKTINLGNYESLRVDVGVELPCYPEEFEEAYQDAYHKAAGKLKELSDEAQGVID